MNARTHDAVAFASLVTVAVANPPQELTVMTIFVALIGNIVGALIPDMDQASNRLWDLFPAGNVVGKVFRRALYKHRTLSHSLLGAFLLFKLLSWLLPKFLNPTFVDVQIVLWSIMIGFFSHLLADSVTKDGLPLFFPIDLDIGFPPIRALRITTGKWVENLIVLPGVGVYTVWFIFRHQAELAAILNLVH